MVAVAAASVSVAVADVAAGGFFVVVLDGFGHGLLAVTPSTSAQVACLYSLPQCQ